jgi:signal transduction histidine kinase
LQTREPLLFTNLTPNAPPGGGAGDFHDPLIARLAPTSILYLPIVARGDAFGVLTFVTGPSGRRFGSRDIATFADLGVRGAMAIENARLYSQAQRAIAARQDVLSFVSHDLKNPLMGIMLSVETILRAAPPEDRRRSASQLHRVMRGAQQMRRMIEDLLDMTMLESGRLNVDIASHDLGKVLEDAVEGFTGRASARQVNLEVALPPDATMVACDRQRLVQVLSNLIDNALKFTPAKGRINVTGRAVEGMALCTVADTGSGIPTSVRPRVFERFVQADAGGREGRGLGLYIAKGLIEGQGGSIWVDSQEGRGTTFSLTLPLTRATAVDSLGTAMETSRGPLGHGPIVRSR